MWKHLTYALGPFKIKRIPMTHGEADYPATKPAQERLFETILDAGRAGKSRAQMAEMIGIGRDTLESWRQRYEALCDVMALADDYALAWWEALGQRHAETREGNATMIMFVMKNRFENDYGKDPMEPDEPLVDTSALAKLTPKTRAKLRKLLQAEAELTTET